jgi:hypothetical protein
VRPCSSTFVGSDGQPTTCVKSEGHGGSHFSIDGELWEDHEQAPALDPADPGAADEPEATSPLTGRG